MAQTQAPVAAPAQAPSMAALPPQLREEFVARMREFRQQVTENAENVGDRFSEEARRIHYGEAKERGIYGSAKPDEAQELMEEGIPVLPLPVLPEDRN